MSVHPMIASALERLDNSSLDLYDRELIRAYVEELEAALETTGRGPRYRTRLAERAVTCATAAEQEAEIRALPEDVVAGLRRLVVLDGDEVELLVDAHEDPVELLSEAGLLIFASGDWRLTPLGRAAVHLLCDDVAD